MRSEGFVITKSSAAERRTPPIVHPQVRCCLASYQFRFFSFTPVLE